MVIPWVGIPLGDVLARFAPTSKAKYVAFRTVFRPEEMRGQSRPILDWPYVEGLRIDEAMHPLTLLAVGALRRGHAQPERRPDPPSSSPWKYGFKSIKSIAAIEFTEEQPPTSWKPGRLPRIRVLLEREIRTSPIPGGANGANGAIGELFKREDADVQRLRGPGRGSLRGDGSQGELLSRGSTAIRAGQGNRMNRERRVAAIKTGLFATAPRPVHGTGRRRVHG